MTEGEMQLAIAKDYGMRYAAIPNVNFAWQGGSFRLTKEQLSLYGDTSKNFWSSHHEADLILVRKDWLIEVEIKVSYQDFLRDFKKKMSHLTRYTKYIYYAFPQELYARYESKISQKLDEGFPQAGVMVVAMKPYRYTGVVRKPKAYKADTMPLDTLYSLLRAGCQKWWRRKCVTEPDAP